MKLPSLHLKIYIFDISYDLIMDISVLTGLDLLQMAIQGLFTLLFAAIGSLLLWKFYGAKIVNHEAGDSVVKAITNPDEKTIAALESLIKNSAPLMWNWFLTSEIKTDHKIKDADGNDTARFETVTPYESIISATAELLFRKAAGAKGAMIRDGKAALGKALGPEGASFLGFEGPQKGEDPWVWRLKQMVTPMIEKAIEAKLKNLVGTTFQVDGAGKW